MDREDAYIAQCELGDAKAQIEQLQAENKQLKAEMDKWNLSAKNIEEDLTFEAEAKRLQAEVEQHRWIPVSERLPKNTDDVWVCSTKVKTLRKFGIGFYSKDCNKWIWFDRTPDVPTHWKPIVLPGQALQK